MITHSFYLFQEFGCLLLLLLFCSLFFPHRSKPLGNTILVPLPKLMISNAGRIVGYENFAGVTPFVALTDPVLEKGKKWDF